MGLLAAAGAVLVALVVLGAPPAAGAELSEVFQNMQKAECYFINGTEKVRLVLRYIYNRQQYVMFDSDVGYHVGYTPWGEEQAQYWNSNPDYMERARTAVDWYCRCWYKTDALFSVERREMPPDAARSKMLTGIGGLVLGSVFLALGLGFYLRKKSS